MLGFAKVYLKITLRFSSLSFKGTVADTVEVKNVA